MNKTLIKHAILINEGNQIKTDVLIENERLVKIAPNIKSDSFMKIIYADGLHLIPGLIDDQVHFREPGMTHKGTIKSESQAAVAGGITSFIEMPNTLPQTTTKKALDEKFEIASLDSAANYSFLFGGTNNNIDEILSVDKNQVAGLKLFLGSSTGNMLLDNQKILRKIFKSSDLLIAVHCEDEKIIQENLNKHIKIYGENIPIEKHPKIRSEEACYASTYRTIQLAKETGARLHVFHLSTAKETELFGNSLPLHKKKITAEVCTHHLIFDDNDYLKKGSLIKWNPAIKSKSDQKALWKALNDDRIDIIATDHAPHTFSEKNKKYTEAPSGGPMVQHSLLALLSSVKKGKITLENLIQKACHNPAILFQIKDRGFIREGYFADFVLIDMKGQSLITKQSLKYKCRWSPFEGHNFDVKIKMTFVNGQKVYEDGKILIPNAGRQLTFNR
ncbi:MAG: dihydroorotase [Flavobacteriaceae bacterium]|nr:dihydroorotase [Flavobacteriaceae bacterium]